MTEPTFVVLEVERDDVILAVTVAGMIEDGLKAGTKAVAERGEPVTLGMHNQLQAVAFMKKTMTTILGAME